MKPVERNTFAGRRVLGISLLGAAVLLGAPAAKADPPQAAQASAPPAAVTATPSATPSVSPGGLTALPPLPRLQLQEAVPPGPFAPTFAGLGETPTRQYRSPGMRIAGIAITGLAAATLVTGGALMIAGIEQGKHCTEDMCGFGEFFFGSFTMIGSVPLAAIGIPLWVVGSLPPKPEKAATVSIRPSSVSVGPGAAVLKWSF